MSKTAARAFERSIPAHAGEPAGTAKPPGRSSVYPRPRGGTLVAVHRERRAVRSIPAHAGEPIGQGKRKQGNPVYPRPRGGTSRHRQPLSHSRGLSPPTRGNRMRYLNVHALAGSIPAHAGEPRPRKPYGRRAEVYPRPRGGTSRASIAYPNPPGLSPPTRGNHPGVETCETLARSIPAHAGEPGVQIDVDRVAMVYPRPRGGTPPRAQKGGF